MNDSQQALLAGNWIDGCRHRPLKVNEDSRGSFTEIFYDTWDTGIDPKQWSVVTSQPKVFRGMHLHLRHDEYICVLRGRGLVGLYDLRPDSPTKGVSSLIELRGDAPACLSFPIGLLHGWYFPEESLHIQAVSETYADYGDDDNWGCHFADPELNLPWPNLDPIISPRAASFPPLRQLCAELDAHRAAAEAGGAGA